MKTILNIKLLILIMMLGFSHPAGARQLTDSLSEYLDIAVKKNPGVLQKYFEYQASLQKVPQAGSLSDPALSMSFFLTPMELIGGKQISEITLMQMFPWFGVLRSARDEMYLMAEAKSALYQDARLQVIFEVRRTWYELFKIRKAILISGQNIDILKSIERLALAKFKTVSSGNQSMAPTGQGMSSDSDPQGNTVTSAMQGMGGGGAGRNAMTSTVTVQGQTSTMGSSPQSSGLADFYRIQMEIGELENNIEVMKTRMKSVTARFNALLNREASFPVFAPDSLVPDTLEQVHGIVSEAFLENNPMPGMLEYESQALEARGKMITRMRYPMVGIGINYSLIARDQMSESHMNGRDMLMPMISLTLPVYRKKYRAQQKETGLLQQAVVQNRLSVLNSLKADYYEALGSYNDSKRRIGLYDKQYDLASKSLNLTIRSFSASGTDLTEVLRIRQQTLDYELKKNEAVADLNIASSLLKRIGNFEPGQTIRESEINY